MKMRFSLLALLLPLGSLWLAACGNATNAATSGMPEESPVATATVSLESKLALGTLKLSSTEQDVTTDQATELLTLWQAYQALSESDTTAQIELDALVQQIQDTLTSEQIQAIDDMGITAASMAEYMQAGMPQASSASSSSASSGQVPGGPDVAGGAPMDGGISPDGGMMVDAGMAGIDLQTASTTTGQSLSQMVTINPTLLSSLLEMLQAKVQAGS